MDTLVGDHVWTHSDLPVSPKRQIRNIFLSHVPVCLYHLFSCRHSYPHGKDANVRSIPLFQWIIGLTAAILSRITALRA